MKNQSKVITKIEKSTMPKVIDRYLVYITQDDKKFKIYDALEQKYLVDYEQRYI